MMRLARSVSILAALCLLASAATASAECAWVLWSNFIFVVATLRPAMRLVLVASGYPRAQERGQSARGP